ncbi:hypothetical protein [Runella rosea]|nr:hypothetical protein [Runella rosea]
MTTNTDDSQNSSLANHRVTILGLKPTAIARPEDGNIVPELDNDF